MNVRRFAPSLRSKSHKLVLKLTMALKAKFTTCAKTAQYLVKFLQKLILLTGTPQQLMQLDLLACFSGDKDMRNRPPYHQDPGCGGTEGSQLADAERGCWSCADVMGNEILGKFAVKYPHMAGAGLEPGLPVW